MENSERQSFTDYSLEEIGQRIKALREGKGWTQEELASKLHLNRSAWKEKEDGRADMKTGTIVQLAQLFGVTTDYILTGIEAKNVDISKVTGLNNAAITYLRHRKNGGAELAAINTLLAEEQGQKIIDDIWLYLQANYTPPLPCITESKEEVSIAAVAYWAKTENEGEEQQLYIKDDILAKMLNKSHLDRISSSIEAWKEGRTAAAESTAPKRGRKKEGTANAAKE